MQSQVRKTGEICHILYTSKDRERMTEMKDLSQILAELANHGSWEGYGLLHYAIEEAIKTQPMPSSMDRLCRELVDVCGKQNPETIYRSIARAVDDIWARPESRLLLREYYRRELVEKPTPDSFISAVARYLWDSQTNGSSIYQITYDYASRRYGVIIHTESSQVWASFPAITEDLARAERIVRFLRRNNVSLEDFKDFYLSGGLQSSETKDRA